MNAPAAPAVLTSAGQAHRRKFLGGSDAAAIIGYSPWKTPLQVYLQKRGEDEPEVIDSDREDLLETGKEMEPVIVNRLVRRFGIKVTKRSTPERPNRYLDPEFDFLAAEVDFEWEVTAKDAARFELPKELIGTIQNGEAKKVHKFATAQFGEAETEEVPVQYAAQAMHGLMVTGRRLCLFAVQLGDDLSVYWIKRDDTTIPGLRAMEVKFWRENVLAGVPPEVKNLPDVLLLFPRDRSIEVVATDPIAAMFDEMQEHKQTVRSLDERIEAIKFELGKFMLGEDAIQREVKKRGGLGDVKPTVAAKPGRHVLTWFEQPLLNVDLQSQSRIDSDKLKKHHPEIATECSKTVTFFKFNPVK